MRHVESISDLYTVQNELAKSRFGTIKYAVNNFIPGRKHAIKVIKKQVLASNPDYETIILKDIHHLGIINVNEILRDADHVYIVMDYENYLQGEVYNQGEVLQLVMQLLSTLKYLENMQIKHRNLTLSHILVGRE